MAYRIEDGESVRDAVRCCSREELDKAIHRLTKEIEDDPVESVHGARKSLKKQRSLLRLSRTAMRPDQRRAEAAVFRDAARRLSATREAEVMTKVLDDVSEHFSDTDSQLAYAAAHEYLVTRRDRERERADRSGAVAAVAVELQAARRRVEDWELRDRGWKALAGGLERSYRRGRHAFKLARAEPTPQNLHDWRKRAKDLWYHLRFLRPLSAATMRGQADQAHRLSDLLGDDHDLWVLREALTSMAGEIPADLEPLVAAVDHRRTELQRDALLLGERVYAERPKAFLRRLRRYWKAWRAETPRGRASARAVSTSG